MDERESSSPVCYLKEEDIFGVVEPEPASDLKGFCDKCRTILNTLFLTRETGIESEVHKFQTDSILLQDAVIKGCPLCVMLFEDIPPTTRLLFDKSREAPENDGLTLAIQIAVLCYVSPALVVIHHQQNDGNELFPNQELRIVASDDTDFHYINEEPLGSSTGSETSMSTALMWIKNCTTAHHKCQQPSNFLPTRLIDVGEGENPQSCLVLSVSLPQDTRYVTLSHCWGSYMPCRLLKDSLSSMINYIDVENLPKTFQDSLTVARNLGQRYIWIDALCIIQDDLEDWGFESARMSEVYLRSVCNISATAAIDGSYGLFYDRNPTPLKNFTFHRDVAGTKREYIFLNSNAWIYGVESAPLNQRAWVFQERILSPCNLHFGRNQLFWECRELSASETLPRGGPGDLLDGSDTKPYISRTLVDCSDVENQQKYLESANVTWRQLVQTYTSTKLTYSKDKLTAMGGLAALWATITQDKYIAGLWEKDLPWRLLWFVSEPRDDHQNRDYTAPSWSWAAIDGEIYLWQNREENDVLLVDSCEAKITLNGEDSFGMVRNGSLTLNGRLFLAEMRWPDGRDHGDFGELAYVESPCCHSSDSFNFYLDLRLSSHWNVTYQTFKKAERINPRSPTRIFYLLPIVESHEYTLNTTRGVILEATKENSLIFQRIGRFKTGELLSGSSISQACQYFNTKAAEMGFRAIDDENGGFKYEITII